MQPLHYHHHIQVFLLLTFVSSLINAASSAKPSTPVTELKACIDDSDCTDVGSNPQQFRCFMVSFPNISSFFFLSKLSDVIKIERDGKRAILLSTIRVQNNIDWNCHICSTNHQQQQSSSFTFSLLHCTCWTGSAN